MPGHWNPMNIFQIEKLDIVHEIKSDILQNEVSFTENKEKCREKIFDKIANMIDSYESKIEEYECSEKTPLMHKILENNFFHYLISSGDIGEKECLQMAKKLTAFIMDIQRESTSNIEKKKSANTLSLKNDNERDNCIGGNDCFGFKKLSDDEKNDDNSYLDLENFYKIEVENIKDLQKSEIVPSGITIRLETEKGNVEIERAMKGDEVVTLVRKEMKCINELPNEKRFSTWLIKTVDQRMELNQTKNNCNMSDLSTFQDLKHSEKSATSNRLNFESNLESNVINKSICDKKKLNSLRALSCKAPNKYCEEVDLYIKKIINLNESHKQRIENLYKNINKSHKNPKNVPSVSKYNLPHEKEIEQLKKKPPVDCQDGTSSKFYSQYSYLIRNLLSLVYK